MNEDDSLRQVIANYHKYVSEGDIQGYMALFNKDAVWMPPNAQDRSGKPEIFKAESGAFAAFKFDFVMTPLEVRTLSDQWAIVSCNSQGTMAPRIGGAGIEFHYRVFFLLEKQVNGNWLIARQIWNQKPGENSPITGGPW